MATDAHPTGVGRRETLSFLSDHLPGDRDVYLKDEPTPACLDSSRPVLDDHGGLLLLRHDLTASMWLLEARLRLGNIIVI